ncbi:MAG TPA: hypothetical protein VFG42_05335 [Baekduia sp.]|uniref:hypothetical protein n=1 Tax=Baekduia sp. TaxID=2600305 RepID=UPI002D76EC3E|nr:hypothetical protein [Baekduia sp.]HET6506190.1 hypothetical protein [Baekduia sp.]
MPAPRDVHRQASNVLSVVLIVLGVAIFVRTLAGASHGFALGFLLGPLFVAAGIGRIYINKRVRGGGGGGTR